MNWGNGCAMEHAHPCNPMKIFHVGIVKVVDPKNYKMHTRGEGKRDEGEGGRRKGLTR
jgi:hypothetical protein